MSKVVVRLHTKAKQGAEYLDFTNEDLLTLNFENQSTTNYSNPIFDTYPSYGNIEIQDKNLVLYNMAINDEFTDYEYPVEIFVNNSIVGKFIITELPVYSYASKTLSITVGDRLSKIDSLYYGGYKYPLEPQTIDVIFKDILKSYDSTLTDEEIETILEESVYSAKTSGLVITHTTYKEYMQTITVPYPYIVANKTFRQAFQQVLTVTQSALITDKVTKYRLVRMDGNSPKAEEESIAILQNQMLSQFIPTIILPNKYNVCEVNSKRVVVDYVKDKTIDTKTYDTTNTSYGNNIVSGVTDNQIGRNAYTLNVVLCAGAYLEWTGITSTTPQGGKQFTDTLSVLLNDNLKEIINLTAEKDKNPSYQVTVKKIVTRQKGHVEYSYDSAENSYFIKPDSFTPLTDAVVEPVSQDYLQMSDIPQSESFSWQNTQEYAEVEATASVSSNVYEERKHDVTRQVADEQYPLGYYLNKLDLLLGKEFSAIGSSYQYTFDGVSAKPQAPTEIETYKYTIKYEFVKFTITYSGDYTEITFNDTTIAKKKAEITKENKVSISSGDTLMQYEGSLTDTSIPYVVADNMLAVFDDGLNGGQVNVMGWDYYGAGTGLSALSKIINYTTTAVSASETSPFQKFFEIGDVVMPCKDNKNTPIIIRGVDYDNNPIPMYFQVVKNSVTFQGGKFSQRLTLREAKMPKKELTIYYPPTLSISGSTLTITPDSRNPEPVQYKIYVDNGREQPYALMTTSDTTINLASYITTAGTYRIYAVTTGTLSTSNPSNKVQYVVALPTQDTPTISLVSGTTIKIESTDENAQTIEVFADGTSIGSVTKQ